MLSMRTINFSYRAKMTAGKGTKVPVVSSKDAGLFASLSVSVNQNREPFLAGG